MATANLATANLATANLATANLATVMPAMSTPCTLHQPAITLHMAMPRMPTLRRRPAFRCCACLPRSACWARCCSSR